MLEPTSNPADFQQSFGAALAGAENGWLADPDIARALTIHRNTSARAAQDALADNYPVVHALVGEEAFMACAAAFVLTHPQAIPGSACMVPVSISFLGLIRRSANIPI